MRRLHDQDVSADKPGLICYDSYRSQLTADPANRAIPEVREVLDRSEVLRNRVTKVLGATPNGAVALRIVDSLAVHRLTTEDIYVPIGATARELRDDLCLMPDGLPERDALFLEASIGAVIDDIVRAVSGQFISENADNGQVWLDVRKDIDYDQKIDERAVSLDDHELDKAYFRALEEVLEQRDAPYVAGFRIWAYELPWQDCNVTRTGYLFMGAPNERPTTRATPASAAAPAKIRTSWIMAEASQGSMPEQPGHSVGQQPRPPSPRRQMLRYREPGPVWKTRPMRHAPERRIPSRQPPGPPRVEPGRSQRTLKRPFDVVVGGLLVLVLSPVLVACTLAVCLSGPGPILFRQRRVGRNGKVFHMHKFRSMVRDAEMRQAALRGRK